MSSFPKSCPKSYFLVFRGLRDSGGPPKMYNFRITQGSDISVGLFKDLSVNLDLSNDKCNFWYML